jgi:hypothetical protein
MVGGKAGDLVFGADDGNVCVEVGCERLAGYFETDAPGVAQGDRYSGSQPLIST